MDNAKIGKKITANKFKYDLNTNIEENWTWKKKREQWKGGRGGRRRYG
jgi:hypothetical protein